MINVNQQIGVHNNCWDGRSSHHLLIGLDWKYLVKTESAKSGLAGFPVMQPRHHSLLR